MAKENLRAIQPTRFVPRTTNSQHGRRMSPNLLVDLKVTRPRQVLVSDITYVPLQKGRWAYLATFQDVYTRRVLGWDIAASMTGELVISALRQALNCGNLKSGTILHSDRGGQYVDAEFRRIIKEHGFLQSMSRAGEVYDNAQAESLWARYKIELLEGGSFRDLTEARIETSAYFGEYYNRKRWHSAIGYQSPEEFESGYYQMAA